MATTTMTISEGGRTSTFRDVPKNLVKGVFTMLGQYKSSEPESPALKAQGTSPRTKKTVGAKQDAFDPRQREIARRKLAHGVTTAQAAGYQVTQTADGKLIFGQYGQLSFPQSRDRSAVRKFVMSSNGCRFGSFRQLDGAYDALPKSVTFAIGAISTAALNHTVELTKEEQIAILRAPRPERQRRQVFQSLDELLGVAKQPVEHKSHAATPVKAVSPKLPAKQPATESTSDDPKWSDMPWDSESQDVELIDDLDYSEVPEPTASFPQQASHDHKQASDVTELTPKAPTAKPPASAQTAAALYSQRVQTSMLAASSAQAPKSQATIIYPLGDSAVLTVEPQGIQPTAQQIQILSALAKGNASKPQNTQQPPNPTQERPSGQQKTAPDERVDLEFERRLVTNDIVWNKVTKRYETTKGLIVRVLLSSQQIVIGALATQGVPLADDHANYIIN
jgi:hypothetical protein